MRLKVLVASLTIAFSCSAVARTAQVCPGPALPPAGCFDVDTSIIGDRPFDEYVITHPGRLLVDVAQRRQEIAALDPYLGGRYCAVNPASFVAGSLPSIAFSDATITFRESRWTDPGGVVRVREYATVAFTGISSSDGTTYPRFGLTFNREQNDPILRLEFFPSVDSNLVGIPGLYRDVYFNVDVVHGANLFQDVSDLSPELRRMLLGIAYRLPSVLSAVPHVTVVPGAVDPLWNLSGVSQAGAQFSSIGFRTATPTFTPILTLSCATGACAEFNDLVRFRDFVVWYGGDYIGTARPEIGAALLDNLRAWAQANALTSYPGATTAGDFQPKYQLQWFLIPVLQAWSVLRKDSIVSPQDRALVDAWLTRVISYALEPFGGPGAPENPFNVGYLVRGLRMAWGIMTGDDNAVAEGMEKVVMGLHQMRSDGSFPREVARGACALRYQDTMLLNLLFIAELAAAQGYDAYALTINGKSLHTAIKFLLDAVDDPSVALQYASQDPSNCTGAPPFPPIDLSSVVGHPNGFNYSAWLEPYMVRFPGHPNTPRLRNLLTGGIEGARPIFHPHSGGNTTCLSAGATTEPIAGAPGPAQVSLNPYGTMSATGATIAGNRISKFRQNSTLQLGSTPGTPGSFVELALQDFSVGSERSLTIQSGASGQSVLLDVSSAAASYVEGAIEARGTSTAAAPVIYIRNAKGIAVSPTGTIVARSGLGLDALDSAGLAGSKVRNDGVADGGPSLKLMAHSVNGGGAFRGDTMLLSILGNANNPANGAHFLSNGLNLFPSSGPRTTVTVNHYGPAPQVVNLMVHGDATFSMPSAWPSGSPLAPNNAPVGAGSTRPPNAPEPAYGGGSSIFQATGSLSLAGGATNDFAFPGGIVLRAGGTLDLAGVTVNQGWTTAGKPFQGIFFESPNIVSAAALSILGNDFNWINFSSLPAAHVRIWRLARNADGSAAYAVADEAAHQNTFSLQVEAAANGECWICLVNPTPIDVR